MVQFMPDEPTACSLIDYPIEINYLRRSEYFWEKVRKNHQGSGRLSLLRVVATGAAARPFHVLPELRGALQN